MIAHSPSPGTGKSQNEQSRSIVHVLWSMDVGGAERAVYQLAREQRRHGRVADLLVASTASFYGEKAREAGATVHELRARSALDLRAAATSVRIASDYDIVHFHGIEPALMRFAARLPRQQLFYTHRAGLFSYPIKQRIRYRLARRELHSGFDGVAANTAHAALAAARLFNIPRDEISVVYNGIDFSLLAPERSRKCILAELGLGSEAVIRIGTSANLRAWKRTELLLHAIAELRDRAIQCVIIGDGPERVALEQLSRRLGIGDRVVFVGIQKHVGDFLRVLDVFTLPSGPEESFGNAAVEAMGCGVPTVIYCDGGGLTEHVIDGHTGFVARDQAEYVQRLKELVGNKTTREAIGTAGMHSVRRKYTPESMVAGYDDFYERRRGQSVEPTRATTCVG